MNLKQLESELQEALSAYASDVQTEIIGNEELLDTNRPLLELLDEMNRHNYYVMNTFKKSIIEYLEGR